VGGERIGAISERGHLQYRYALISAAGCERRSRRPATRSSNVLRVHRAEPRIDPSGRDGFLGIEDTAVGGGARVAHRPRPEGDDRPGDQRSPAYLGGILEMANSRLYDFWGGLTDAPFNSWCRSAGFSRTEIVPWPDR
jgi:hypothetical protein